MTFAILGRCPKTAQVGVALATSSIAVGARCPWAWAGVGTVATQNVTDPSLGPRVLDLMERGLEPQAALAELAGEPNIEHRQLLAIDIEGRTAVYSGAATLGVHATAEGRDCCAGGNLLANTDVPSAMTAAFEAATGALAERLLAALAAGLAAGGEAGDIHSAAMVVADKAAWPYADLRIDWTDADPVAELALLWAAYAPQAEAYVTRALDPGKAPSYNVPGEE